MTHSADKGSQSDQLEPTRWRKKPVVIEAMRWDGTRQSIDAICRWANDYRPVEEDPWITYVYTGGLDDVGQILTATAGDYVLIDTLEGLMRAEPGDWIIKGVKGEFYPCKSDIFEATYEPA